jgi:hypothetical protein
LYGSAAVTGREFPSRGNVLGKRRSSCNAFDAARLIGETPYGLFAAVGQGKSSRVAESVRRAVDDFGHEGEGSHRSCANAWREQQIREVFRQ